MAEHVRFEIYIPVVYFVTEQDGPGGKRPIAHAIDDVLLRQFIRETVGKYHGITQANPLAPALYKGWWRPKKKRSVTMDHLTYLFGLVRIDQFDKAKHFFDGWAKKFADAEEQDVILLVYYPVHTIGDFFDE